TCPQRIIKTEKTDGGRANVQITPGTVPTSREGEFFDCGLPIAAKLQTSFEWNYIYLTFAKAQGGLDCFDQSCANFLGNSDTILNDLHTRAEPFGFWIRVVHAHDFVVDPNAQISLLLEEIEKLLRLGFRGHCDPECDENLFVDVVTQNLLRNRLRGFRSNFTTATRTERVRDTRPEKFQIIVDLRHCADG